MSTRAHQDANDQNPHTEAISDTNSSAPERPLLEVRGLNAGYGETQVLWDISLDVFRGEVVALVGANGAGKSTLLTTISGLLLSWKGTIVFAERDITHYRAERIVKLGLAQIPQGRRLFGGLTIEENLRLGAYTKRARSTSAIAADLERVYTFLPKLRERRTQLAGSLSGGEQQMCAIGRGLMARPDLLLIDELSLGLAPNVVDDLLAAVDDIHRQEQLSFLLVEQDVQIALERANRGYVIESGHIVLNGPAADLLKSEKIRMAYLGE
jgi:branched-chain amino acid transport system ATP-binding protein